MPAVVKVSEVEKDRDIAAEIEEYLNQGKYTEIVQLVSLHAVLMDPQHLMQDQKSLFQTTLSIIKNKIAGRLGNQYGVWYSDFPKLLDRIIANGQAPGDPRSAEALSSHRAAYGQFRSLEDFFFWALDDRRLTLDQIIKYIDKTAAMN